MASAADMASAAEYRRLLKGLENQSKQSRPPVRSVRRSARAKAVYPAKNRTRSLEPLGSIDEIVMESDFSDSAISPPPSHRQRRPSTPMNFSRPDPANFSPRLSREPAGDQPPESNGHISLPVRSAKAGNTRGKSRSEATLPDEPSFDESDDEQYFISRTSPHPRPQPYANDQRYVRRPSSAGTGTARPSTSDAPRIPSRTHSAADVRKNSSANSRSSSRLELSNTSQDGDPSISYSAVNMTAPLPQLKRNYTSTSTQTTEERERSQQERQTQKIVKRLNAEQKSGRRATEEKAAGASRPKTNGHLTAPSSSSNSGEPSKKSNSSSRTSNRGGGRKSQRRPERTQASAPSQHSSEDTNVDEERPPCWAGSDFDPRSVLTDKEIAKLKKKGINPALYAEMQAAKQSGQESSGGGKSRKWIGPLVGNGYTG